MKIIFQYVLKHINAYRSKFLKTALICFICSLFIIGQSVVLYSYIHTSEIKREYQYGVHDYIAVAETNSAFDIVCNDYQIEQIGKISVYTAGQTTNFKNKYFLIGVVDTDLSEINRIHTLYGKMPTAINEIAIEQSTLAVFFPDAAVGDTITILINGKKQEFTLSGILADYSNKQWQRDGNEYSLPNAFISKETAYSTCDEAMFTFVSVKLSEQEKKEEFYKKMVDQSDVLYVQENHQKKASIGSFWGVDEKLFGLISLIATFTLSVVLLFNLIASKRAYDENKTGRLKLLGFSSNDLIIFHIIKTIIEVFPSIFLGSFFGVIIAKFVLNSIDEIDFFINYSLISLSFVISLIIFCSILSIDVKKRVSDTVCSNLNGYIKTKNINKKSNFYSDNPRLLFSVKSYMLRPDVSTASALMLLLSIVVLYIGMFASSSIKYTSEHSVPVDYSVNVYDGYYDKTSYIPLRPFVGVSDEDIAMFYKCDEIKRILPIKSIGMFSTNRGYFVDMSDEEKKYYGFSVENDLYPVSMIGTNTQNLNKIIRQYCSPDIDVSTLKNGKYVIAINRDTDTYQQGDIINLTQAIYSDNSIKTVSFCVTVIATIDENQLFDNSLEQDALLGASLLWNEISFDIVGIPLNYKTLYINAINPNKTAKIDSLLYEITSIYEANANIQIFRNLEERIQLKSISDSFGWVSKITSIAFALVSVSSMIININIRTKQRKKIIGTLRACGLTEKDYIQIAITENLIEAGVPIVVGNVVGITSCRILNNSIFSVPLSNIPMNIMFVFSIVYLIFSIITATTSAFRFFKIPISVCIREKE